jgi:putative NADH-flavin reductase
MKVVLLGATGRTGSRIRRELLSRSHQVVAVVRDPGTLQPEPGVSIAVDDLTDVSKTAAVMKGADAVISAYAPPQKDTDQLVAVTKLLVEAVKRSGVPRFLMVGGAGSLEVKPGVTLIDSGYLPSEWMGIAKSHEKALEVLRSSDIDWTYLAPAGFFEPGTRTGRFTLGTDNLITNDKGESRVSMEDYAIAMVDEIEKPQHHRQRFSVGYTA